MKLTTCAAGLFTFLALSTVLESGEREVAATLLYEPKDETRSRVVPVKVYLPKTESACPVILFSHGLGGSRMNNPYLGNHWAGQGYVVVFMQHAGSDEEVWKSVPIRERLSAMKKAAGVQAALDRYADVPFVIDQLEKWNSQEGHALHGRLNLELIGMSGHSFGAHTTQAMMGQKYPGDRTVGDERIDAFVAMSPSTHKRMAPEESFGHIKAPVLLMTGTKDASVITPDTTPEKRMAVYAAMPGGDKYHLVLKDAEHHAFGDSERRNATRMDHHHDAILALTTRFWDAYLKGDPEAKSELQSAAIRVKANLVEGDVWEWK